jgi:hypothetical protein
MAGLLAVENPNAYADTADTTLARHRVNLAERAKAVTGLYLFQIEGLIHAKVRARERGIVDVPSMVHEAWLRWLQLHGRFAQIEVPMDGWMVSEFPSELLADDPELFDLVGQATAIGHSNSRTTTISVPSEFRIPSVEFARSVGMPDFSVETASLIGLRYRI